ncbi:class I SAM-dependent methyltransferase [Glutamicibacter uratoxydans]|uniref:class I SAM-dependent methyltransferase n=1 Tax=Glutamicibacter uratoxydans TaxID=43667 RepID=UPI0011446163
MQDHGQPALELGCGDNGPFYERAAAGLDIVGVDSSSDMIVRGREHLEREGITAQILHQKMEELNLESTIASI